MERIRRYAVRLLAVLFCLAAAADLRPFAGVGDTLPVAVVDVSASVGGGGAQLPEGIRARPHWILVADGTQDVVGEAEPVRLGRAGTKLGEALRHAGAAHPGADVLLLTDGRGTDGDAVAAAHRVAAAGGRVFVAAPARPPADVGLLSARLLSGAPEVDVEVEVSASTSGQVRLQLSRGGRVVDRKSLEMGPGEHRRLVLTDPGAPRDGGGYQVLVVPGAGTPNDDVGDDRLSVGLRSERRVVLTFGLGKESGTLAGPDLVVRGLEDTGGRADLGALEAADCLVLSNVPWRDIGTAAADAIGRFVASGGSLLVLGGPDAYAGGGWAGTRFESRLSPLRVPRDEGTGLGLVLALDRSGSTAGATLAHLQEAARRALQGLTPDERMAVLPFASHPATSVLPPGVLGHGEADRLADLLAAVDGLEAGGGTDLPAAILAAARRAIGIEAREHRVLLLTDGDPDHPPDEAALRSVASFLREHDVGFAAFVVGDAEAVKRLRETVARAPEDVHALTGPRDLPGHLLHWLGGQRDLQSRLPRPMRIVAAPGANLPFDLGGFLPRRLQQLEVAADEGARAVALAEYGDPAHPSVPFAASRRVGAGLVGGLAWGPMFEPHTERAAALARLAPWVRRLASRADRGLAADVEGEMLVVHFPSARGSGVLRAWSERGETELIESAPGRFRGPLPPAAEQGVWVGTGERTARVPRPLRLPSRPPAESRGTGLDEAAMAAIAEAGGGRRLAPGEQPPRPTRAPGPPLAPWLLLAACILLVLDRVWSKPLGSLTES